QMAHSYCLALGRLTAQDWHSVCALTQMARRGHRFRLVVEARNIEQAIALLQQYLAGDGDIVNGTYGFRELRKSELKYADQTSSATTTAQAREDWLIGLKVDWQQFWSGLPRKIVLPTYPFKRDPHWLNVAEATVDGKISHQRDDGAISDGAEIWRGRLVE